jgi:hypothetical protein
MKKGGVIMKQKKLKKKLNLNKETVAILDSRQIGAVYGGGGDPVYCDTWQIHSCLTNTQDPTILIVCCF